MTGWRKGTLRATRPRPGPAFKAGDTVTLGVPWLTPHGELLPTFDLGDPREAAQAVVQAAVADWLNLPAGPPAHNGG